MDTVTHALIGALVVQTRKKRNFTEADLSHSTRIVVVAIAAAFPDIDYLTFWLDPYSFLTEWHRALTHSVVMIPVWALILGVAMSMMVGRIKLWRVFTGLCALGLFLHVLADFITLFEIQLFAPLSEFRSSLSITFDVDPWMTVIVSIALIGSRFSPKFAQCGVLVLLLYLVMRVSLQQVALSIAKESLYNHQTSETEAFALPQPLLPIQWKLVVKDQEHIAIAYLSLLDHDLHPYFKWNELLSSMFLAYRSENKLIWTQRHQFGADNDTRKLTAEVWQQNAFKKFREFAKFPALYRIDTGDANARLKTCVWFSDLRYDLPVLDAPFRFGMCRQTDNSAWQLYRLRRMSQNDRQRLDEKPKI